MARKPAPISGARLRHYPRLIMAAARNRGPFAIGILPLVLAAAAALAAGLAAPRALAQQERPLMLHTGASRTWDSNPLRAPEARSDRITTLSAGLRLDQPYAQQRFLLDVTG